MSDQTARTCPSCGAPATGAYCSACGARVGPRTCAACHAELSAQARFCHRCGQPTGGSSRGSERKAWIFAGAAVAALVAIIAMKVLHDRPAAAVPDMANAGNAAPSGAPRSGDPGGTLPSGRAPDISKLSPSERFLRLNNRVMEAAARGDSATVVNFTPMALGAYAQLDSATNDERYHAAILHAEVGELPEARALADSMLLRSPGYLLAYAVRAQVAEFDRDSTALRRALADFRAHDAAESAARRPEYTEHADVLADLRRRAAP